jgi:EAL domain-containing protein (putative c-di-GMP-specific phosphodiesterase class I)
MRLKDVLALPKSSDSIELLKTFLNQPLSYHDYMAAFLHYMSILFQIKAYDILIQESISVVKKYDTTQYDVSMDEVLHILINTLLEREAFDQVYLYIEKRKNKLPYQDKYKVFLQEYTYLTKLNKPTELFLKEIMELPMTDALSQFFISKIIEGLIDRKEFLEAQTQLNAFNHILKDDMISLKLPILLGLKSYSEILEILKPLMHHMTHEYLYYLLNAYIGLNSLQKAINLEVDNEALLELESPYQLLLYQTLLDMYKSMNNMMSIKIYEEKINKFKSLHKKKNKVLQELPSINQHQLPQYNQVIKSQNAPSIETFEKVIDFMQKVSSLDMTWPFREILRNMSMYLQLLSPIHTIVMYALHEKQLFIFKKDRLYDKKLKPVNLEHTMIDYIQHTMIEGYIDLHHFENKKDIVTDQLYQGVHHMYGYKNDFMIMMGYYHEAGEIYASEVDILSVYFNQVLQVYQFKNALQSYKFQTDMFQNLLKHPQLLIRIYLDGLCQYSLQAKSLFSIQDETTLNDFIHIVPIHQKSSYQEHIKNLYNYVSSESQFNLEIDGRSYREYAFVKNHEDQPLVISYFIDMTEIEQKQKTFVEHVHTDSVTQLSNMAGFQKQFNMHVHTKCTFLKIELSKQIKYLYGQKHYLQYFKEFAHLTKKLCQTDFIYVMDEQHVIVVLNYNDIRAVTKTIRLYMDKVLSWIPKSIPQETFTPYVGVLRYPVVTTDQNMEVILEYLDIALLKAQHAVYPFMHDFQYQDYEDDQKEQYILDQMHEAINHKQFSIGFHQIINQTQNKVWMYESFAYIPHLDVDEKDMRKIAKKRKRIHELDLTHFERVCLMLSEMYTLTSKYIKILVPMDKETLIHHLTLETLSKLIQEYQIPPHIIHINIDGDFKASVHSVLFDDLQRLGIDIHVSSLKTALYYHCEALHFDIKNPDSKMIQYLKTIQTFCETNHMTFVVRNVSNKDIKNLLQKEMLSYIEGPIYKRLTQDALFTKVIQK